MATGGDELASSFSVLPVATAGGTVAVHAPLLARNGSAALSDVAPLAESNAAVFAASWSPDDGVASSPLIPVSTAGAATREPCDDADADTSCSRSGGGGTASVVKRIALDGLHHNDLARLVREVWAHRLLAAEAHHLVPLRASYLALVDPSAAPTTAAATTPARVGPGGETTDAPAHAASVPLPRQHSLDDVRRDFVASTSPSAKSAAAAVSSSTEPPATSASPPDTTCATASLPSARGRTSA